MAFLSKQSKLTGTLANVYTTPAGKTAIIFSGIVSNIDTTNQEIVVVDIQLTHGSTTTSILTGVPICYGGSLVLPKIVVQENGILKAKVTNTADANKIDLTLSILEQDK